MQVSRLSKIFISILTAGIISSLLIIAQDKIPEERPDWEGGEPDGCTTIAVGKLASYDGSVMTSHTDDSHRTRSSMDIVPAMTHPNGTMRELFKRGNDDTKKMPSYSDILTGRIPQVDYTHGYINTAYACINDKQVAIGETTFGKPDARAF